MRKKNVKVLLIFCLLVGMFYFESSKVDAKEFNFTDSYEFDETSAYGHFYGISNNDDTTFVVAGSNQRLDYNNKVVYGIVAKYNINGERIWESIDTAADRFMDVVKTTDNNFVVVGQRHISEDVNCDYIVKYNANGEVMWKKTYGDESFNHEFYKVVSTSDNGVIAVGFYSVVKFNEDGNVVWEWNDNDLLEGLVDIKPVTGGYIIIANQSYEYIYEEYKTSGVIYKIDDSGTIKETI